MITRPSLSDIKYSDMSKHETMLNYDRDVALWEQTEALKKIAEGRTDGPVFTSGEENSYSMSCDELLGLFEGTEVFKRNSYEWYEYQNIYRENEQILNDLNNIFFSDFSGVLLMLSCTVSIALPMALILESIKLGIAVGISIAISLLALLFVKAKERRLKIKFEKNKQKMKDLVQRAYIVKLKNEETK